MHFTGAPHEANGGISGDATASRGHWVGLWLGRGLGAPNTSAEPQPGDFKVSEIYTSICIVGLVSR